MKQQLKLLTGLVWYLLLSALTLAEEVADPIKDFLSLPIADRYTNASVVVGVERYMVDIDGDGTDEVLVGHHKMWHGSNVGVFCAAYKPSSDGRFDRLTPRDGDVAINRRFFGTWGTTFVGFIEEVQSQGILVLGHDFYEEGMESYSSRRVMFISEGKLEIKELGPLDLTTPEGKAFYERYFGENVESRPIVESDYTAEQLEALGYELPDWTVPLKGYESSEDSDAVFERSESNQSIQSQLQSNEASESRQETFSFPWLWVGASIVLLVVAFLFVGKWKRG